MYKYFRKIDKFICTKLNFDYRFYAQNKVIRSKTYLGISVLSFILHIDAVPPMQFHAQNEIL